MEEGQTFGYHPEPVKCYLILHPDYLESGQKMFEDLKINIVTSCMFLGGFIGSAGDEANWFEQKVEEWVKSVIKISNAATNNLHTAYTVFSQSL